MKKVDSTLIHVSGQNSSPLPPPPFALMEGAALFLDFDGTLVPLARTPDSVEVDPDLHPLLVAISDQLGGRLAIVSGRSVATLRQLFGLDRFILAGSHGLEIGYPGKGAEGPPPHPALDPIETALIDFIKERPGLLVERKSVSIGLHYRNAPEWMEECRIYATMLAERAGMLVQPGDMLFEIRPGGATKGTAIAGLMDSALMQGARPVMIGDDLTDENGFAICRDLGGAGILVGPLRETAAYWRLEQVGAVRHYLAGCLAHLKAATSTPAMDHS